MLDELRNAARKVGSERSLRGLLIDCKRLLSERGEANSVGIAHDLVARFSALPDEQQGTFFERLSSDFSPDPKAVLKSAQAYADAPNAQNLALLTQTTEPPRQELLRRINRSPGGTSSIVAMRRAAARARGARSPSCRRWRPTSCTCCRAGSTPAFCSCSGSTGTRRRSCWSRSSSTKRCTRSTAGTTCAAACSPTAAASRSSTRSCRTSR